MESQQDFKIIKMDINDFYSLSTKLSSSTFQAHPVGLNSTFNKRGQFDENKLTLGTYRGISFPVIFKQKYGNKLHDVLDTGSTSLYLISERMKNFLALNKLSGWKNFPVKVYDKRGNEVSGYYGFSITGRCGKVRYDRCEIIEKQVISGGPFHKYYKGLYIGLDKWDGKDFFIPENSLWIIVSPKAVSLIKKYKLSNLTLENLSKITLPDYIVENKMKQLTNN